MKYPSSLNPPYLTLDRCLETGELKLCIIFTDLVCSSHQQKFISSVFLILMSACIGLLVEKALLFQDLDLTLFLILGFFYFSFCQSRSIASCQLANLAWLLLWNSYRNLTITSTLLLSLVKFLTVQNKRTFRNDGLFHIIYAEESTNFLVNFEDS